jgi:hypothetical protein
VTLDNLAVRSRLRLKFGQLRRQWKFFVATSTCTLILAILAILKWHGFNASSFADSLAFAFAFALLPNVFSTALLYFFSPDAISLRADISRHTKTNSELIDDMLSQRASKYWIRILDTRITNLLTTRGGPKDDSSWFEESVIASIKRDRNKVKILLQNPFSESVFQRAKDRKQDRQKFMTEHLDGLFRLNAMRSRLGSDLSKSLVVQLYDIMVPPAIHVFDGHGYVTFFPPVGDTDVSPAIRFDVSTDFGHQVMDHFDEICQDDDTVDLEHLMYCSHSSGHLKAQFLHVARNADDAREPTHLLLPHSEAANRSFSGSRRLEFGLSGRLFKARVSRVDQATDGDEFHSVRAEAIGRYHFTPTDAQAALGDGPIILRIDGFDNRPY